MDKLVELLPWGISLVNIVAMVMIGRKLSQGWIVSLVLQAVRLVWIVMTDTWGFIPLNLVMWGVSVNNWWKWRNDVTPWMPSKDRPMTEFCPICGHQLYCHKCVRCMHTVRSYDVKPWDAHEFRPQWKVGDKEADDE